MHFRRISIAAAAVFAATFAAAPNSAVAQSGKQLTGSWSVISVSVEDGGKKIEPFGPNPSGLFMFDGKRFTIMVARNNLAKIASNNRATATTQENQSIVQGSLAYFGTYTVNEAEKSFITRVEGSTFPNWTGTDQKRMFEVTADSLTITNPTGSVGGVATVRLKRAQ